MKRVNVWIEPDMLEYIKSKKTDLRIATTCEGPLIFSIKTSPPKETDFYMEVEGKRIYISAVQAPLIKSINRRMLPRCALERRR